MELCEGNYDDSDDIPHKSTDSFEVNFTDSRWPFCGPTTEIMSVQQNKT